jgi:hypothetical protein
MIDADDITSLQKQLAAHRATLVVLLRQVATHTEAYAPPAQISGIAEARREIARLKAALRAAGVVVEDQADDEAAPDEVAVSTGAPIASKSAIETAPGAEQQPRNTTICITGDGNVIGDSNIVSVKKR